MNLSQVVQVDLTNVIQLTLPSAGSDNMEGGVFFFLREGVVLVRRQNALVKIATKQNLGCLMILEGGGSAERFI